MEFVSGGVCLLPGDPLLVGESETTLLRRVVLGGPELDRVTADDVVVKDCQFDIALSLEALVYYRATTTRSAA